MTRVYRAGDAPHGGLAGESVAVLGYGHLGRTAALNLRDSGAKVRIGNREDAYAEQARVEGFEVVPLSTAAGGDVVYVLTRSSPRSSRARSRRCCGRIARSPSARATAWPSI